MLPILQKQLFEQALSVGRYTKNIQYMPIITNHDEGFRLAHATSKLGGQPAQTGFVIQQMYHRQGKQIHVQKEVSDHLLETKFSVGTQMDFIPWRGSVVEMYFEDPKLPTMLLMKKRPEEIAHILPYMFYQADRQSEEITAILQQGEFDMRTGYGGTLHSCVLTPALYEQFLVTGETKRMDQEGWSFSSLNERDNAFLYTMLLLALKVFVFASLERYRPAPLTRKAIHFGGKAGVKGRPDKPAERVFYAPNVKYLYEDRSDSIETGQKRRFLGRDWVWRYYKDERYVKMKGKWDLLPPIHVEHRAPETIKVRMPKAV